MKIAKCGLCKNDLPVAAKSKEWGWQYGGYKYCSYGCMRNKQAEILRKQAEKDKERAERRKKAVLNERTPETPEVTQEEWDRRVAEAAAVPDEHLAIADKVGKMMTDAIENGGILEPETQKEDEQMQEQEKTGNVGTREPVEEQKPVEEMTPVVLPEGKDDALIICMKRGEAMTLAEMVRQILEETLEKGAGTRMDIFKFADAVNGLAKLEGVERG